MPCGHVLVHVLFLSLQYKFRPWLKLTTPQEVEQKGLQWTSMGMKIGGDLQRDFTPYRLDCWCRSIGCHADGLAVSQRVPRTLAMPELPVEDSKEDVRGRTQDGSLRRWDKWIRQGFDHCLLGG
eukprot:3591754-Amphidinium_carterae.1